MPSILSEVARSFAAAGIDLEGLGLAWARVAPSVAIVPAFGLRALPAPARSILALALAAVVLPAVPPLSPADRPWLLQAGVEVLRGLPVAFAAAVPLWAATMAGGVADALRNAPESMDVPTVEGRATPLGVPLSLLACAIFLATGGPARVVLALAGASATTSSALVAAAHDIAAGITLAVAVGGPLLAAAVVVEVAGALVARAASPAQLHLLLAPVRALALLVVLAVVLERVSAVLALSVVGAQLP